MPVKSADTYHNLLRRYNRTVPKIETCECGKLTWKMEDHLKTGTHKLLMFYKKQYEEMTKEAQAHKPQQNCQDEKKTKKPSKWAQVVHAS